MLNKDTAICLRKVNYSETSQVVTLFGRDSGKIPAMAKGSRRAKSSFDGPIEVLSYGEIVFADSASRKLATLTEFQQRPVFLQLRKRTFTLNIAFFAVELIDSFLQDHDPHPLLFDNFVRTLKDVQASDELADALKLLILFQLGLLQEVGTRPVLNKCANCSAPFENDWRHTYFCSSANGLVCNNCEASFVDKIKLSGPCAACLADLKQIAASEGTTLNEIQRVLIYHFTELLHRPPRMAKYFT